MWDLFAYLEVDVIKSLLTKMDKYRPRKMGRQKQCVKLECASALRKFRSNFQINREYETEKYSLERLIFQDVQSHYGIRTLSYRPSFLLCEVPTVLYFLVFFVISGNCASCDVSFSSLLKKRVGENGIFEPCLPCVTCCSDYLPLPGSHTRVTDEDVVQTPLCPRNNRFLVC